ncbi:hypothetical protein E8E12_000788 [Didymella heteroderae]|uniref:Uncharacterized protein n=1 Tax=Didymella heteroderae TaxID=1769908 RepID=A0A9P5BVG6_9PLEO|nr:hypothetical protein E8E12_000788 [Didymella heteroderae]
MPATQADTQEAGEPKTVRLHITPLKPELLKVYLAPSVLPLARNVSYHAVETFPEKGFGYVELPEPEAQKIRKKLNGTTLKGSKVRIEMAKPEKRKAREDADADAEDKPAKRSKKDKKEKKKDKSDKSEKRKRSPGVFDGVQLPEDRKVKRGWTEPVTAKSKSKSKDNKDKKSKDDKHQSKPSKYTKEPELLFKAKLEPVAATEHTRKEKKKDKKDKKERKTKTKEVIVHEFEKNTKTPSFLKAAKVSMKPPVDYVDGVGWVDEDGAVVEPETKKAAHSRVLQLVDGQPLKEPPPTDSQGRPIVKKDAPKPAEKPKKKKKATPPPESSSESELDEESSVVSSSSEDEDSSSDSSSDDEDESERPSASPTPSPAQTKSTAKPSQPAAPTSAPTPSTVTESKEVHPLEALFKRAPPPSLSTPTKPPPINTSFSFFDNETTSPPAGGEVGGEPVGEPIDAPTTPFTQRDLEWRGLRSAAPTPDTAAIGRRFSFDWRKGSHEADDDEELSDGGIEAGRQLDLNTKANSQALADVQEGDENEEGHAKEGTQEESEFRKWFWENRGDINRAWKKRRREALKAKRHADNRKMTGGRRVA